MAPSLNKIRLDASESLFFQRELEAVDKRIYDVVFPENMARSLIPTQDGVPEWAKVYTWRLFESFGEAIIAANTSTDIPRADANGVETSKVIKPIVSSFGWDIFEIKAAAKTGAPLSTHKALAARMAVDNLVDSILAVGDSAHGLTGLLNLSNTTSFTPATKAAGGTAWLTATPDEMAQDMYDIVSAIIVAMKNAGSPIFRTFTLVLPVAAYLQVSQTRMGDGSDDTILRHVLKNSPFIKEIEMWHKCDDAGGGSATRMVCYPKNPLVVAGIVPMEFTTLAPELRGLEQVVTALATCGGVVVRYPVSVAYGDAI